MFRGGISCSSMGVKFGATLRPDGTACGVNPNIIIDDDGRWWLLSYLNSNLCLYVTRGVIIRANMITAGYAARIPVPDLSNGCFLRLAELGRQGFTEAKGGRSTDKVKAEIDSSLAAELAIAESTNELLKQFERDPIRLA
jgi:hypothetical protein